MNDLLLNIGEVLRFFSPLIIFMVLAILLEAVIMFALKLNRFGKCLSDSAMGNIATLLLCILLFGLLAEMEVGNIEIPFALTIGGMYVLSLFAEAIVLKLLNKQKTWGNILKASALMNLVTSVLFYGIFALLTNGLDLTSV